MKNLKIVLAAVIIAVGSLSVSSCKRGSGDPFISLHSRDARLIGVWLLTGLNHKQVNTSVNGNTVTTTESTTTYENGTQTTKTGNQATTQKFNFTFTTDKAGEYHSEIDNFDVSGKLTGHQEWEGSWSWLDMNKAKMALLIALVTPDFFQVNPYGNLTVKELRNNKLVLTRHIFIKQASGNNSSETLWDQEFTFERQKK